MRRLLGVAVLALPGILGQGASSMSQAPVAAPTTNAPVAVRNLLIEAAKRGDAPTVEAAVAGADRAALEATDGLGRTALHYAARLGHEAAVETLLAAGAPVEAEDRAGFTPLLRAVQGGDANLGVVRLLLAAGADPSTRAEGRDAHALAAALGAEEIRGALEALAPD
jgi:uncharacterized protein